MAEVDHDEPVILQLPITRYELEKWLGRAHNALGNDGCNDDEHDALVDIVSIIGRAVE